MRSIIRKIIIAIIAFISFFGIMIFFINSSTLMNVLAKYLHLHPMYEGGVIAADVYDTAGDDNGNGNLVYPANAAFEKGSLDLIRYTVHEPVIDAKWQQNAEYWQLELEYMSAPANVRNVMIYIDLNNVEDGCAEPLFDAAENVTFNSENSWDIAIWIHDGQGKVYDSQKVYLCNTEYYELEGGKIIKINIPMQNEYLQAVYGATKTYHYVLAGGTSQFDRGGFMPIEKRRSNSRGGTKNAREYNALIPKVYDVLGENAQLGTWNAQDFSKALLVPVEVEMHPFAATGKAWKGNKTGGSAADEAFMQKVFDEYSKYAPKTDGMYEAPDEYAATLKQKITENPDDYVSMAYYGSCLALQGGQASVLQAVALVNEAFEYLDKAVELSKGKTGEIDVLMNRANVAYSVPNEVFGKTETAAVDFMRIISLYKEIIGENEQELAKTENKYALAYCYVMASKCYKNLGRQTDEILALQEAKKLIE